MWAKTSDRVSRVRFFSIFAIGLLAACGEHDDHGHLDMGHDHAHAPRMGGHLIELGDHEFQVEIVLYPETGTLEAYVWDGHVEHDVPVAMKSLAVHATVGDTSHEIVLHGDANLYGKNAEGKWSKFKGQHDSLKKVDHFDGALAEMTIAGKTFPAAVFHYHLGGNSGEHDHEH
jgi:hypothetical protein